MDPSDRCKQACKDTDFMTSIMRDDLKIYFNCGHNISQIRTRTSLKFYNGIHTHVYAYPHPHTHMESTAKIKIPLQMKFILFKIIL